MYEALSALLSFFLLSLSAAEATKARYEFAARPLRRCSWPSLSVEFGLASHQAQVCVMEVGCLRQAPGLSVVWSALRRSTPGRSALLRSADLVDVCGGRLGAIASLVQ